MEEIIDKHVLGANYSFGQILQANNFSSVNYTQKDEDEPLVGARRTFADITFPSTPK